VLDAALAQFPDAHRHGTNILIRADSAGSAKAFLAHIRGLRSRGIHTSFSVGWSITEPVRRAIRQLPDHVWHPALEQDGTLRQGAQVAELTVLVDLPGLPEDTRIIVRRERPHPGAQLSLFATSRTPVSRTSSAAAKPPASAASPPDTSTSTKHGWSCP
jgi:hypothetical protein